MNEAKKPGVMFYFDQCAIFRQMPMEDVYALVMATLDFAENGVVPEFKNPALRDAGPGSSRTRRMRMHASDANRRP